MGDALTSRHVIANQTYPAHLLLWTYNLRVYNLQITHLLGSLNIVELPLVNQGGSGGIPIKTSSYWHWSYHYDISLYCLYNGNTYTQKSGLYNEMVPEHQMAIWLLSADKADFDLKIYYLFSLFVNCQCCIKMLRIFCPKRTHSDTQTRRQTQVTIRPAGQNRSRVKTMVTNG